MDKCLTIELSLLNISGCLVEKPECGYAHKLGFGMVCRHPDHTKFHAHVAATMTKDEACVLYDKLRRKRRDEFMASLDETSREFFSHQTGFFGQSLQTPEESLRGI